MPIRDDLVLTDEQKALMRRDFLFPGAERAHLNRAITILHNMALEHRSPWKRFFRRWYISDEPLRNDAARFLKDLGVHQMTPEAARVYDPDSTV